MRLFVALDIPNAVRELLIELIRDLRPLASSARWVRMEGAHITLKFIGETPEERIEQIRHSLSSIRVAHSIEMRFGGLGFFPGEKRPRVLWAGVEAGPELGALATAIEDALEPLGIARESREFNPHITLARFEEPKGLDALRQAVQRRGTPDFGRVTTGEFHLYRSVLKRGGAEYTRLSSFPVSGESVP